MIKQDYLTNNDCYKQGRKMQIKGLMLHSVGCGVENPMNFIKSWNKSGVYKCVHAFIDEHDVYETLPHDYRAWHCGKGEKGSFNDGYMGVEMCEPSSIVYISGSSFVDKDAEHTKKFVKNTYKVAVEYFAHLCSKYCLNPLAKNVIVSHSEGHRLGFASDHGDVEHLWDYVGLRMNQFRKDVFYSMVKNIKDKSAQRESIVKILSDCIIAENMLINEKMSKVHTIKVENYNYVKLDDLKNLGLSVGYDKANKIVSINFAVAKA